MNKDLEKIDSRSEKVRGIMGEEPPWWIKYGTSIIVILLVLMALITHWI